MSDDLSIAASGLDAASALLNATANNIVNEDTPGYQPEDIEFLDLPDHGGVEAQVVVQPDQGAGGEGVDPVAQAINFRRAQYLYDANAAVIQASQYMFGTLLNMLDTEPDQPPAAVGNDV